MFLQLSKNRIFLNKSTVLNRQCRFPASGKVRIGQELA